MLGRATAANFCPLLDLDSQFVLVESYEQDRQLSGRTTLLMQKRQGLQANAGSKVVPPGPAQGNGQDLVLAQHSLSLMTEVKADQARQMGK